MADPVLEVEATLTDKYQTTVPSPVRQALKLRKRDKIVFRVAPDGETVTLSKVAAPGDEDPVIATFLRFLERDLMAHPERLRPLQKSLVERARQLTRGMTVNLDERLTDE